MKFGRLIAIGLIVTLIGVLALIVLILFDHILMGALSMIPGLGWLEGWSGLLIAFWVWIFLPDRYKALQVKYDIRGSAVIDAPAETIWNLMRPREGRDYFLNSVTHVTAVEGEPDRVDLHFDNKFAETPLPSLQVVIEEQETLAYLRMGYLNADAFPLWSKDLANTEYFMEREGDAWRVTHIEHLERLRLITILALLFLNPCRDGVKRLKALSEGQEDTSWMGRMSRDTGPNGEPPKEMAQTIRVVGITACVTVTAFTAGMLWFIAHLVSP